MTDENNVTAQAHRVEIAGVTYNVNPEVLTEYYRRYAMASAEIDNFKNELKEEVEGAEEATGIPKKIIKKFFATTYKQSLDDEQQTNEAVQSLRKVIGK
jgi:hypothetical protein